MDDDWSSTIATQLQSYQYLSAFITETVINVQMRCMNPWKKFKWKWKWSACTGDKWEEFGKACIVFLSLQKII